MDTINCVRTLTDIVVTMLMMSQKERFVSNYLEFVGRIIEGMVAV